MSTVRIERGSTRAIIHVNPYDSGAAAVRNVIHHNLTDYERVQDRWTHRWAVVPIRKFIYVNDPSTLFIPINALPHILDELDEAGVPVEVVDEPIITPKPLHIRMVDGFTPRPQQVDVIQYLTDESCMRKGLATATGSGKTVSSIASMVKLGYVGMIIVSGLTDQWVRSIFQFTTATPEQVYSIQGFSSITDLLEGSVYPDIFVCSLETVRLWVNRKNNYQDLPTWFKFLSTFGVGTKIMDEVHLNFHADTIIDLNSNIKNNIYLTATFSAANPTTRRIFNMIYPYDMRFGESTGKHYIDVYTYGYTGDVKESQCVKSRGYSHAKYERVLLKKPKYLLSYFNYVIKPIVDLHYISKKKPGQKLLIYFYRLDMVDKAYDWFKTTYPTLKIVKYVMGVPDTVLADNDIIISTPKKAGCGTDIKQLKTVIQTVSVKADTLVDQSRGRLRELPDGDIPEYIELLDINIQAQKRHYRERKYLHQAKARRVYYNVLVC